MKRTDKIVYAARNKVNNKAYIGFCVNFKERKIRHLRCARNGTSNYFYNALRKYGIENFEWIILFDDLGSIEDCKIMEKKMVALFDTYINGYNGTRGGSGGNTFNGSNNSGIFKKGHIPWHKEKKMSEEYCKILSDAQKRYYTKHNTLKRKQIKQLTKYGELIMVWESVTGVGQLLGITPSGISRVARQKKGTAGGFKWEYIAN